MKHDTSFIRIIYITITCLLVFPLGYQTVTQYYSSSQTQKKHEAIEVFSEYQLVQQYINRAFKETGQWPNSLAEANYLSHEYLLSFDLTEAWALKAKINHKVLNKELIGHQIKFVLNPETGAWFCDKQSTDLPRRYAPKSCEGQLDQFLNSLSTKTWSILIAATALIIMLLLALYRHPLLKQLRANQFSLSKTQFHQLQKLSTLSKFTGHTKPILEANNLTPDEWQNLTSKTNPSDLLKTLMRSLPIDQVKTENRLLYRLTVSDQFELNINTLLLLISNEKNSRKIIARINQITDQTTPLLVWVSDEKCNIELRSQRSRLNKTCLIPTSQQMTELVLFISAKSTLIKLAARNLPLTSISPYQGKGGITKNSHFFGRKAIIDKLELNHRSHFLLVGGRQLGKTSLLKALYRKLSQQADNHCLYISLSDDRLLPRLAYYSGIKDYQHLDDLLKKIQTKHPTKKIRLLIDEADLFIQSEVISNFKTLNQIRQSAEHQNCQFIFAGFWELYAHAVLDYHSPLRNLADSITIGALEPTPGQQLISQPMALLGQQFANDKVIQDIYYNSGGRANLINLICEYLVEQLTSQPQTIDEKLVQQAFKSESIQDALLGWSSLSADPQACSIDRVIVYLTFIHKKINLNGIIKIFDQNQITLGPEELQRSLQRLRLAHIILKNQQQFVFAVPLFAQQHEPNEATALLEQELIHLKS